MGSKGQGFDPDEIERLMGEQGADGGEAPGGQAASTRAPGRKGLAGLEAAAEGMGAGERTSGGLSEKQREEWDAVVKKLSDAADKLLKVAERMSEPGRDKAPGGPRPTSPEAANKGARPAPGGGGMDDLVRLFGMAAEFIG